MDKISAAAIARILSNAGIQKAQKTGWSTGFDVVGYGVVVEVIYQTSSPEDEAAALKQIVETLNGRKDQKYFAVTETGLHGTRVRVVGRTPEVVAEAEAQEQEQGSLVKDVRHALTGPFYAFIEGSASGFTVKACEDGGVEVFFQDLPHTTYGDGLDKESCAAMSAKGYADRLDKSGFAVVLLGDRVRVGRQAPETFKTAKEALSALRAGVEAKELSFMTRKGDSESSLFVYYLIPFKDKLRRMEVSWADGAFYSSGRFGGETVKMGSVDEVVTMACNELAD